MRIKRVFALLMSFAVAFNFLMPSDFSVVAAGNASDVKLTLTEGNGSNEYYKEYIVKLTNNSSESITGIQCLLPTSGSVSGIQCWGSGLKASYSSEEGGIVFYYSLQINAGATAYSTDTKFGFSLNGVSVNPSGAKVLAVNCANTTSSNLKYKLTGTTAAVAFAKTPVGQHGALHLGKVSGYKAPVIVGADGVKVNLRGASTHGMHWNEMTPYVNKAAFQSLRDEWGVNTVRLVSYVTQGGYTAGSKEKLDTAIQNGVSYCKDLGMYAIIDWHVHAEDPWANVNDAKAFFTKYATMYKNYDNVIFEICNEPTGVQWYTGGNDLYSYCKTIAKIIRDCGSNAIIVCGTNTWSQDVDEVSGHELKDDGFSNIMYTFHFYAASHYSDKMDKVTAAYNAEVPIFVTEFGTCDASGAGGYDFGNADDWIKLLDKYGIPYCNWSLCNKSEAASMLSSSSSKTAGGWLEDDLSESGCWLVNTYRSHQDAENGTDTKLKETATTTSTTKTSEASTASTTTAASSNATTTQIATTEASKASANATTEAKKTSADATTEAPKASSNASANATTEAATTKTAATTEGKQNSTATTTAVNATTETSTTEIGPVVTPGASMKSIYKVYYKYKGKYKKMPKTLKITNKKKRTIVCRDSAKRKAKAVKFKVAKKKVLRITSKGVIKPKKVGITKVTVIYSDKSKRTFKIRVTKKAIK